MSTTPRLLEAAFAHAEADPGALALVHLGDDGTQTRLDRGSWRRAVWASAHALASDGVAAGDVVLLAQGHDPSLPVSVWAALSLGAHPCLVPPPGETDDEFAYAARLGRWIEASHARLAIVAANLSPASLEGRLGRTRCGVRHAPPAGAARAVAAPPPPRPAGLVQLSSGTTGAQKLVRIGEAAVLGVAEATVRALAIRPGDVVVNWLPLHHDLGLFTGLIVPAIAGIPTVLLSARRWARNPAAMFHAGQRHGGTLAWMPNFAFEHCARAVRRHDSHGLDLSGWRLLMNAAEPVRPETLERFSRRFARHGLRREALCTGYGLAEHLGATASAVGSIPTVDLVDRVALERHGTATPAPPGDPSPASVVGCGQPLPGVELRIADASGGALPPRRVGEVWLRSPYLFEAYQGRSDLTEAALCDGWYRTGDLGYRVDGELFVCGRIKELIIVAGRNLHPHEIESALAGVAGIRPGRIAAIGVPDDALGTERVVVYYEPLGRVGARDTSRIESEMRAAARSQLDLVVSEFRAVPRGSIPRTSSGKLARAVLRSEHLAKARQP